METSNIQLSPILKWVGGKRQLLNEITPIVPQNIKTYYEVFFGGGAVLFSLQPKNAVINDLNKELINVYTVIRDKPEELIFMLKEHKEKHCEEYFYNIRNIDRDRSLFNKLSDVEKASRILYLNKTCYNGLFRVNSSGEYNSPFGKYKNPKILDETLIMNIHNYFSDNNITILNTDYENALQNAKEGDFVYLDPPYKPLSETSSFTGYTSNGFNDEQQIRLKNICDDLNNRNVKFLLSNSSHPMIYDLYENNYFIQNVSAKRMINSKAEGRGDITEVLIRNYE